LTLALVLRERGAKVFFICRELPGNSIALVERQDFNVFSLPYNDKVNLQASELDDLPRHGMWLREHLQTDIAQTKKCLSSLSDINQGAIDWLIVDHYAIDIKWERALRPYFKHLMIIDDLADRYHDCEILLDQNFYSNYQYRYQQLVPKSCNLLLGPQYALLRPEFGEMHRCVKMRNGEISNILVFMGGSDSTNETKKVLLALEKINFAGVVNVVVGYSNPYRDEIIEICNRHENYKFYCQVDNMAELMNKADLAIGAGGSTTWERCCLALPSLVISVAENQVVLAQDADQAQSDGLGIPTRVLRHVQGSADGRVGGKHVR
jgi:UDP-2,4-diacetamido-2,4,6-trideoxy-beta-L-altropyranose hydrolase